ncbi:MULTISPECIES: alpha/beta hydrolase [Streptomyces]|uniref:Alpha/beta hydrolase n=2 Tax=Streptomyces TaxID=1883 RepID=A0ABU2PXL4_9ACTN|nr:alpha/beta hydrolase [Streptomyces sp. DSM 41636]MDT0395729.1 alpha/beta hydrolase [Streptomyces sp. DSM 41636]
MSTTAPAGSLRPARTTTVTLENPPGGDPVEITTTDTDRTRPFLLLHGGGGVATVSAFADLLAERTHSRVLVPTHPGFDGTRRPEHLSSVIDLARSYVALLDRLALADVTVIGNSFGGWVAAEIALLDSPRVSGAVLVNAIGLEVEGHPLTNIATLTPAERAARSFHDPSRAPRPPAQSGAGSAAGPSPDIAALAAYTGPSMTDPTLAGRLKTLDLPVHVVWGASDGIVDVAHGRAFAEAIPLSHLTVLPAAGHLPQLETPEELLGALLDVGRD